MSHTTRNTLKIGAATLALIGSMGTAQMASADQVFVDDVIVDGSLCAGQDCVNGEAFGFDTVRLKENNLRIGFNDTSASASFPANDWEITINDSANGGGNYFGVTDVTAGQRPFTVEAGAGNNALVVESGGNIGIGTANPVLEVHVADGDSPGLRIEQDGSSGFTPQTWDIAGNETNFFVRDVTNGSALPFKIFPGAASNSLVIAADEDIGMGTSSPTASLHINRANATMLINDSATVQQADVLLTLENQGNPQILFKNRANGSEWNWGAGTRFVVSSLTTNRAMVLEPNGDMEIAGTLTTTGSCSVGCDAVFDEDYDLPTIEEHAEAMWEKGYLPTVGPTQSGPIDMTQKMIGMLNELEKAHIYIDQMHREQKALHAEKSAMLARLDALEAKLDER